jgi:hypothetical protein
MTSTLKTKLSSSGHRYGFDPASVTYQQPLIPWKGKTFNQIVGSLQKNTNNFTSTNPAILRRPLPQKLYRKEFATSLSIPQSQRSSIKFDDMNAPNGYSITAKLTTPSNLSTTLDINYINNQTEHPGACSAFNDTKPCLSTVSNAKARVRSAGMYPKNFNPNRNNDSVYHSSTRDYLVSRSKTFDQNQYQFFRKGESKLYKPGQTANSFFNDTQAQGIQHCFFNGNISQTTLANIPHKTVSYKPNNWKFATQGAVDSSCLTSSKNTDCNKVCMKYPHKQFPIVSVIKDSLRKVR